MRMEMDSERSIRPRMQREDSRLFKLERCCPSPWGMGWGSRIRDGGGDIQVSPSVVGSTSSRGESYRIKASLPVYRDPGSSPRVLHKIGNQPVIA
jgi:hypothetical protein